MCFDVSIPMRLICSTDGLLCLTSLTTSFWHIDAVGGRPHQQTVRRLRKPRYLTGPLDPRFDRSSSRCALAPGVDACADDIRRVPCRPRALFVTRCRTG